MHQTGSWQPLKRWWWGRSTPSAAGGGSPYLLLHLCLVLGLSASCRSQSAADWYAKQYGCEASATEQTAANRYVVHGCAGPTAYYCARDTCIPNELPEAEDESSDETKVLASDQSKAAASKAKPTADVSALVRLDRGFGLLLQARTWEGSVRVRGGLVSAGRRVDDLKNCKLEWMINGQRIQSPEAHFERDAGVGGLVATLSPHFVQELGAARQIALRACDRRFRLKAEAVHEVREFVAGYESERAWNDDATESTGGMLAPSGGWPSWKPVPKMQRAARGSEPNTKSLFELLAPSVFRVEAILTDGSALGSAVAVRSDLLLTNCHVVAGARKITVHKDEQEWLGSLRYADPKTDRCVLNVKGANLTPIKGIRSYDSLTVGEALYTLGTPAGLDLTLADGILSGLRTLDDGVRFVQTTAPISPGSSGGGLFDARGNLVGITTLVLAGRERLNQSLNFAIPAAAFFEE